MFSPNSAITTKIESIKTKLDECAALINNLLKPAIDLGYESKLGHFTHSDIVVPCKQMLLDIGLIKIWLKSLPISSVDKAILSKIDAKSEEICKLLKDGEVPLVVQKAIDSISVELGLKEAKHGPKSPRKS